MPKLRWLRSALFIFFLYMLGSLIFMGVMNWPSNQIVKKWTQPKEVDYKSFGPYSLWVMEGAIEWHNLSFRRRHYLFIGRLDAPIYGYLVDYNFHGDSEDINSYIGQSSVEWVPEGVTIVEGSGHRFSVPKEKFVGGR